MTTQSEATIILNQVRKNILPCPYCGSDEISYVYKESYGHGDSGYEHARVMCKNCFCSIGNGHNYGTPSDKDKILAYITWNEFSSKLTANYIKNQP